jgi:hypothetical protein
MRLRLFALVPADHKFSCPIWARAKRLPFSLSSNLGMSAPSIWGLRRC